MWWLTNLGLWPCEAEMLACHWQESTWSVVLMVRDLLKSNKREILIMIRGTTQKYNKQFYQKVETFCLVGNMIRVFQQDHQDYSATFIPLHLGSVQTKHCLLFRVLLHYCSKPSQSCEYDVNKENLSTIYIFTLTVLYSSLTSFGLSWHTNAYT